MPYVNPFTGNAGVNPFIRAYSNLSPESTEYEALNTDTSSGLGFLSDFLKQGFYGNQQGDFEGWLRGRYNSLLNQYGARDMSVPAADQLTWMDFLRQRVPDLLGDWSRMSASQRGMRPENFYSFRTRWIR